MNVQTLDLDIGKRGNGQCIRIGQGDSGGTTITATIYDNGSAIDLTGTTVELVVRLPDRIHYYRGECTVSGSTAMHVCDESKLAAVPGFTDEAYFTVTVSGSTFSTERFALDIVRSATDGLAPAESYDGKIERIISDGSAAVSAANDAAAKATSAASSATSAAEAANKSASSNTDAATAATEAATKANAAADSATSAASGATSAAANAASAADSATSAASAATSAASTAETQQAKNNADQAQNNAAAKGLTYQIVASGGYRSNGSHNVPTATSGRTGVAYLTPNLNQESNNLYESWMWVNDAWELMGEDKHVAPTTTDDVDSIVGGTGVTADRYLNSTGLSYLWTKLVAWATGKFAALKHTHPASDVTSGTLSADRLPTVPIAHGGTGATTAAAALTNLGAASESELATVRDSVSQFDMTVDANSAPSMLDAIKKVVDSMDSQRVNFACGQYYLSGWHGFVAMRYKSGEAYAAVLTFNAWGEATLYSENDGTWTSKSL